MMKKKTLSLVLTFTIIFSGLIFSVTATSSEIVNKEAPKLNQTDTQLVIYTYESLLADPPYNFTSEFEKRYNLPAGSVKLVLFDDANTILTRLILEKDDPQADVVIGLDNVLVHKAKENGVLQPYDSNLLGTKIPLTLVNSLDPEHYLLPYDYGIISFWADKSRIGDLLSKTENITLDDFKNNSTLSDMLIVENPIYSSPGLAFLLWTIAVYGDKDHGITGVLGEGDWKEWWEITAPHLRIVKSWGEAIDEFFLPEANRPIMISYGTSPAYNLCNYNDSSTVAFVSNEKGNSYAWYQVEGIGLVKNAKHEDLAKQFIDWFLSEDLQQNIPLHQWMYPANNNVTLPPCYQQSAIDPSKVKLLNDYIPSDKLKTYLDTWLDEWENVIAGASKENDSILPSPSLIIVTGTLIFVAVIPVLTRKNN